MTKVTNLFLVTVLGLFVVGCASTPKTQMSQLQLRELQTRTFETNNSKMVMKAMLNVLQDDGYVVKNAVMDLGLLSAAKEVDLENKTHSGWAKFFWGDNAVYVKHMTMEASANVTELGDTIQVRINFQMKSFNNKGGVHEVQTVEDASHYQEFFSKVSKGIFIQGEKI